MPPRNIPLTTKQRAILFAELKRLESAGLPAIQALSLVSQHEPLLKKALIHMCQQLNAGRSIAEAGFNAGIFDVTHKTLIHAAEISGRLTDIYGALADYYSILNRRINQVKSRLYLPGLMLIIALFVQPLPALIGSSISGFAYLQLSLGRLLFIGLAVISLVRFPRLLSGLGLESNWHRFLLRLPGVSSWLVNRQINQFFFILALMLESGLSFADALPKAIASIKNSGLKENFSTALAMRTSGASVADCLSTVPLISSNWLGIIKSSENSGKLSSGILHFSRIEAENINLQDEAFAEWLPRIIYAIIAGWMAYSLLNSQITTVLPTSL
jgi:general secretion pathway protein F